MSSPDAFFRLREKVAGWYFWITGEDELAVPTVISSSVIVVCDSFWAERW
jgi:hypothetical protein